MTGRGQLKPKAPAGTKSGGPARKIPEEIFSERAAEAELNRLCRKHHINRRRCGLYCFRDLAEKYGVINRIHEAEKFPGCIPEFLGYLNQDPPLPDAVSFAAILWAAIESYKQEGGGYNE